MKKAHNFQYFLTALLLYFLETVEEMKNLTILQKKIKKYVLDFAKMGPNATKRFVLIDGLLFFKTGSNILIK